MGYSWCQADCGDDTYKKRPVKIEKFLYRELEIATGSFGGESFLGRGSHGTVYKGVLEGGKLVAVKKRSSGLQELKDERSFVNEIQILSKLHSPRLVNLVGISHDSKETLMVVEFMANGTLYDNLHSYPKPPSWSRRVHIAMQIAKAIRALHNASPLVIHRDIKSSNVLIDENWNAKLGDFGLALRGNLKDIKSNSAPPAGTIGYLDPSYITPANLSTKNDVFSFGILLFEVISGRNAIDVRYDPPAVVDWALPLIKQDKVLQLCDPRLRQPRSMSGIKKIAYIAASCVRTDKEQRPSMNQVVQELKSVCKSFPRPLLNGLTNRIRRQQGKSYTTASNTKKPFTRDSPRIARLDKNLPTEEVTVSGEAGTASRRTTGRNLMDFFNEKSEYSGCKTVDWNVLAKSSSTFISLPGLIQTQEMFLRSSSLPTFNGCGKDSLREIRKATSINAAKSCKRESNSILETSAPSSCFSLDT